MSPRSAVLALFLVGACGGKEMERAERDRVVARIDALRGSDGAAPAARRRALEELESVAAASPLAIEARDTCVTAYRSLLEGKAQSDEAEAAMKSGERVDPIDVTRKLDAAEKLIERSKGDMPNCDQAAAALRTQKL